MQNTGQGLLKMPLRTYLIYFHDFINKSDVTDIKLLIAADHVNYYDDKASAKSVNISFYTHNLTSNDSNYEAHVYKDLLFKEELGNSKYVEID